MKLCPQCKTNPVSHPFNHCETCHMLGAYFQYEVAGSKISNPDYCFKAELKEWRSKLTQGDIEDIRRNYWER